MKIEEAFYIGYITKTKGLKGEVQLFFEEDVELLKDWRKNPSTWSPTV